MTRRPCQYCHSPLGRFAKVLHIWTCRNCAYRMSMGTSPSRPPEPPVGSPGKGASPEARSRPG